MTTPAAMLRAALFSLLVALLAPAFDIQVPLTTNLRQDVLAEWNLNAPPNPNITDHLVFETVYSLLQHWPNTRMRNGHNIVPGTIPKGTLLYHGTSSNKLPPGPEWVATDPEHSYIFCRDRPMHFQQGCWQLTLATTRPLKIVYFDGSSAVKMPYGSMDTQDLLAWGKPGTGGGIMTDEIQRIQDLCDWGKSFGVPVDGFVRMEMDFEVMLCNFTSGVSMVSFSHLTAGNAFDPTKTSPIFFESMNAGIWHNHFPGETRVQLDLAGLISFYDTQLAPSLVDIRAGQERWDHRVQNVSSENLSAIKSRVEAVLSRPAGLSSGIDWRTLVQVIVDRYAQRLEFMHHLLNSSTTHPDEIIDVAIKAQIQLRIMLTPYLLFMATPTNSSDKADPQWANPIFQLCATTHTNSLESESDPMTDSEILLLQAVQGTTREICRVITKMWAAGVHVGLDPSLNTKESPDIDEVTHLWNAWEEDLDRLMAWLDWSVWVKCDPVCGLKEMCWLPTWPIGFPRRGGQSPKPPYPSTYPGPPPDGPPHPNPERVTSSDLRTMVLESLAEDMWNTFKPGPDDWIRPQPRCIRRVHPYDM